MIPKKIHYCWFGHNPLPPEAVRCIESWKKFLPDYEIIEWNEDNFDINEIRYTSDAYTAKKYAFVSDYVRFKVLYEQGGIYFDTDVEVISPLDDVIDAGPFMGFETDPGPENEEHPFGTVNAGLGLGATAGMPLYKEILDNYLKNEFTTSQTVVDYVSEILRKRGLKPEPGIQQVAGVTIYPTDWFNPFDERMGRVYPTKNTRTIHWFAKSWVSKWRQRRHRFTQFLHRHIGYKFTGAIKKQLERLLKRKI